MILLDTSFCVDWLRENAKSVQGPATKKLSEIADLPLAISMFTFCELEAGAQFSRERESELKKVRRLVDHVTTIFPGRGFAAIYGETVQTLKSYGS